MDLYQAILRPLVFAGLRADPETIHQQFLRACTWLNQSGDRDTLATQIRGQIKAQCTYDSPRLKQTLWGLDFPNPIGLAAGFDKDGTASSIWADFGFGFAEVGTVTYHPQPGNPRPRLFRLPQDRASINRMGFNNGGAATMAERLKQEAHGRSYPLGINLGKSKITPLEDAKADYLASFQLLYPWGDYFVVNVSSPNTPGLRSLQARDQLEPILESLQRANNPPKPLLVKIAPDLTWEDIRDVVDLARQYELAGIIATNTTLSRTGLKTHHVSVHGHWSRNRQSPAEVAGGLSGAPLAQRSTEIIRFIHDYTQGTFPIIGVGGIFTLADVWAKLEAGASLVQLYTSWAYEGPWLLRRLLQGLDQQLQGANLETLGAISRR
ncbi:quinone-dependent dihydroorotate dehydrogenase [Candidatus Synechococcus calcipolaris G9]|uniref:Dihydroorotate dehydrogenase (quinone) n=1 Tax=Candidatus Synechococcus calcipolaris G9 TaxID=1497997 RepID=A0ABT6F301_9SYNE|nr:quinone-dependent dihydroorotate dehydrogenase [Candidatus Synechococcus calcipolaris]MDG2992232.1 quinone-dependent dihydroorotate dehydrogenase [Candidatus Synechococcus calcipolaris G9]